MTTNNKEPNAFIHPNFSSTSDIDSSQSDDQGYEDSQKSNRNGRIFSYPDIETAKVDEDATKNTITTDTVLSNSNGDDEKDKDGGINDESQTEAHGNKTQEEFHNDEKDAKLAGWLKILGVGFRKAAKPVWVVYGDDTGKLYYYRRADNLLPLGEIDLKNSSLSYDASNSEKPGMFKIM